MNEEITNGITSHQQESLSESNSLYVNTDHSQIEMDLTISTKDCKKHNIVSKFIQRLSKPDLLVKHKKPSKTKSQNNENSVNHECKTLTDHEIVNTDEIQNHRSSKSKKFRKLFNRFGKRKSKTDKFSDSSSNLGSRPSVSNADTHVVCVGSCNDVSADKVCREDIGKYNSSSVNCIIDHQIKKWIKDRESLSSNSSDQRDHEQTMNDSDTHVVSILSNDVAPVEKSSDHETGSNFVNVDKDAKNCTSTIANEEGDNICKINGDEKVSSRSKQSSEGSDILLRTSSRPNEIQLRRSRVTSQTSIARSSLIMVAVSHNSPRTKSVVANVGTPSPTYPIKRMDFEEESRLIEEEKMDKIVSEKNGNDFLKISARYEQDINGKIEIVEQYMKTFVEEMNDDVIGQLNTAVGLAKLLLNEKFVQFRGLCEQNVNETNDNGFKTLCCDLEGYLMTLEIQIADLDKNFQLVEKIRINKWQMPTEDVTEICKIVKKTKPKPKPVRSNEETKNQRSLEAKKRIAEYKKKCAANSQGSVNFMVIE